ncbi:protein with signal peptide and transmembrane domain [Cryptosporidium sp. chipmunk genotype I]|uniref:protein with signal peptide and transmembrane domain n=1 Tax=Cryptosporidium sp. chipmunk genotype I TaxID=1280935 RepID=UPI00351A3DA2|nr:protein with signal peptide and transmembrane domain [Cryptosporidium sp. chipmunk genotype I]
MDLFWHKFICSIILLISATVGYFFPAKINNNEKNKRRSKILPILTAFGAGAFIALALVHLIPDAIEESNSGLLSFKIAGIEVNCVCHLILLGFLFSIIFESIADEYFGTNELHSHSHSHSHNRSRHNTNSNNLKDNINSNIISTNVSSEYSSDEDSCIIDKFDTDLKISKENSSLCISNPINKHTVPSSKKAKISLSEDDCVSKTESGKSSIGFVLVCALFFHSLFEGMVVGTSKSIMGTWMITCVIFAHKWIEILIVYMTLASKGVNPLAYIIILSFGSPLGTMIGATVIFSNSVASAVCSALAAGTILYVACIEVIPDVFNDKHSIRTFIKLSSFIAGILTVSSITLVSEIVENSY